MYLNACIADGQCFFLQEDRGVEFFVYKYLRDSFNAKLEEYQLIYLYEVPFTTKIIDLIECVKTDMQSSTFNYRLSDEPRGHYLPHEVLPLQLLEIMNSGHPRSADDQIRLRAAAYSPDLTVVDLAGNKTKFAVPAIAIEGTRFVIHFGSFLAVFLFN